MNYLTKSQYETYSESDRSILYKLLKKIIINSRIKFFYYFVKNTNYKNNSSVIDIGTTPSLNNEHNIILRKTKKNRNITCLSNQDCKILNKKFKNLKKILIADGKNTGLKSNSFSIVHSNATIEHVGSYQNQIAFLKELVRISKDYVFIQTPNRFYPIDFHTLIPFIHWLPKKIHRKILKILNLNFYSFEKNLNLLSKKDLVNICNKLKVTKYEIIEHKIFFFTSNLILIIKK